MRRCVHTVIAFFFTLLLTGVFALPALGAGSSSFPPIRFRSIGTSDGLSQSDVYSILQDSRGLMWFGSDEGLNRYNGYGFQRYYQEQDRVQSLSFNSVRAMCEDSAGLLWVGTHSGLNAYDREKDVFRRYGLGDGLSNVDVRTLMVDQDGELWVGTAGGGVFRYQAAADRFEPLQAGRLANMLVTSLTQDGRGHVWVGTTQGLYVYDKATGRLEEMAHQMPTGGKVLDVRCLMVADDGTVWVGTYGLGVFGYVLRENRFSHFHPGTHSGMGGDEILAMAEDGEGRLWLGIEGNGLHILDVKAGRFLNGGSVADEDLEAATIISIFRDQEANMWIGVYAEGIKLYNPREVFAHYQHRAAANNTLNDNKVMAFHEDAEGRWWVGTDGGGLNEYDPAAGEWQHHMAEQGMGLSSNHVLCIAEDAGGYLWLGTYKGGVNRFDPRTGRSQAFMPGGEAAVQGHANVWAVMVASDGRVWCGTSAGVSIYDPAGGSWHNYRREAGVGGSLSNDDVRSIYEDVKGDVWVGTFDGLNRYEASRDGFTAYFLPQDEASITAKGILDIMEDRHLNIWIGTFGAGLHRFDRATEGFVTFTTNDGLLNDVVYSIEEDLGGMLWVSTNKGLSRVNGPEGKFWNYTAEDGVQEGKFNYSSSLRLADGRLMFGGTNGFNVFDPEGLPTTGRWPRLVFTDFRLYNEPVDIGAENSPLTAHVAEADAVRLQPGQRMFTLSFASLAYTYAHKVRYRYQLQGFDAKWNTIGTRRTATYTNVPPGDYTLLVEATDEQGQWHPEGAALVVKVMPYFWETLWFKVGMGMLVALALLGIYRWRLHAMKQQQVALNALVEERTAQLREEQKKALDQSAKLLEAEHMNAELIQQQLREQLTFREKELTTHTLHTIHKNELLKRLRDGLKRIVGQTSGAVAEGSKEVKGLIGQIDDSFELDKDWEQFNVLFSEVHKGFIRALMSRFPDLTDTNLRLCYLYRMDLSSKDIATTLGISLNSVKVARHRLRKKLELQEEEDLREFLRNLDAEPSGKLAASTSVQEPEVEAVESRIEQAVEGA